MIIKKNAAAFILSILASSAFADDAGKYYIAADLGSATYSGATITVGGVPSTFANPGTTNLAAGYRFNSNFSLELGYHQLGDSTLSNSIGGVTLSAKSVTLSAIGAYPLNSTFDLLGKVGFASNSYTVAATGGYTFADGTQSASGSSSGTNWGVGAAYHATTKVGVRAMYESLGTFATGVTASAVTLGVTYDF